MLSQETEDCYPFMPKMFGKSTLENDLNLTPSLPFENCK